MTDTRFDVLAIGNAIVDVLSPCDDAFLIAEGLDKGAMALIDTDRANALYAHMGPAREISGGSAANTCAGLAALGSRAAFIGQVADDQLGEVFAHDIRAAGIHFEVAPRDGNPPTARCLILVTPDGQRTMNTFLGASQHLSSGAIDAELIASAKVLYLEGYLWDPDGPRAAMKGAIQAAREAGRQVAFTLSDAFLLDRHGDDFRALIDEGMIDVLFANEVELLGLTGAPDFEAGLAALAPKLPVLVATRSEKGAVAIAGESRAEVAAEPIDRVVDTTGAGDSFAAGFLHGHVRGATLLDCLTMGAVAAAEVINHYGARPEADLKVMIADRLG
ncbi:adenosine kinase [Croceicoccus ponticola]|uniref:Adenosine kinase n=1 Tax=Croceicoccus ponticola TaxID=2217664 RepID=A0A437GYA8_9SPHN|nr:adenosine kinase [Croceicoccus ponticola]RVQ67653.1 adenosine kinase [Croceicoccus ponticola]